MAQLQIPHFTFCLQNESARRSDLHQNCHQCVKSHCPLNYYQGECERCRRKDRHASATKRSSLGTANAKIIKNHPKPSKTTKLRWSLCLILSLGTRVSLDSLAIWTPRSSARLRRTAGLMALGEDGDGVGSRRRMGLSDAETRSDTKPFLPHKH